MRCLALSDLGKHQHQRSLMLPPGGPPPLQAHSFELDMDTSTYGEYLRGGIVTQFKEPKQLAFKRLAKVHVHGDC